METICGEQIFSLYASKLFKIAELQVPNLHCYADDTQLYIAFRPGNDLEETAALTAMESCLADISQWMHTNKLKLNSDKTECLLIGRRQQLQKVGNISMLSVGNSQIASSCEVRNLGTWFDSKMSMVCHINRTCSSPFYYLYNIRRIRKYLSCSVVDYWGWDELQSHIDDLTKPQPISLQCNTVGDEGRFTLLATPVGARQPHLDRSFLTTIYHQLTAEGYLIKKQKEDDILYKVADTVPETWSHEYGEAIRQYPIKGKDACNLLGTYKENVVLHINSMQYFGPLKMYCYRCTKLQPCDETNEGNSVTWHSLHVNDPRETRVQENIPFFCRQCEDQLDQGTRYVSASSGIVCY